MYYENESFDKSDVDPRDKFRNSWDAPFDNEMPNQNPQITSEKRVSFAVSQDSEGNFFSLGKETERKVESWYGFNEKEVLENEAAKGYINAIPNPLLDLSLREPTKFEVDGEEIELPAAMSPEEFNREYYSEDEIEDIPPSPIVYPTIRDQWESEIGQSPFWDDLNKKG